MRVAIVHDWLVTWAGAEKVLKELLKTFPGAEIFTIVNFLSDDDRTHIDDHKIHTSFIQRIPFAQKHYRNYLPLMPFAIEQFDMSGFDLIISSSHAVAKGVLTSPHQIHLCYCYTPMRYAWSMQGSYLKSTNSRGLKSFLMRWFLFKIRMWDYISAQRVDSFVGCSNYIVNRIEKFYGKTAFSIYPPVDISSIPFLAKKGETYLAASRLVPYKRLDIIIEAFNEMPDKKLILIGDGPDFSKLKAMANSNITLLGYQPDTVLHKHLAESKAFIFMANEDFGILPVEAQAAGTPVIGYGVGGLKETVVHGVTGLHVTDQNARSLITSIHTFESIKINEPERFGAEECLSNARKFSPEIFRTEIEKWVERETLPLLGKGD